ncbi:3'-5' exonuclease family protein [Synechococcus sp. SYN20]|uniref:DNA polymerase n=1 Tax=Synechococcus sp. SYN20 TaxID=1050714 RepID=UPI00164961A5|nr:DNA polymerase [Synechococcus sp. SYN20]QNJ25656.1 3'-5' exonuclease family protein [Synechococcus sp. SYN20]
MDHKFDQLQAQEFLGALGKEPETTRIRGFYEKTDLRKGGRKGNLCPNLINEWQEDGRGVYVVINEGGDRDEDITHCNTLFNEWDDQPKEWQRTAWKALGLPEPSIQADSGNKSIHSYWVLSDSISAKQFRGLQTRLAEFCNSDSTLFNPSRVMRLPGTCRGDGKPVQLISNTGYQYDHAFFDQLLPPLEEVKKEKKARRYKYEPRSLEEIRDALSTIPPRVPGTGTYIQYRNILWGLIKAVGEAGGTKDDAIALMKQHSPQWTDIDQVANSGGDLVNAGSFWFHAQEHGYQLKNNATSFGHRKQDPTRKEVEQRTYLELLNELLDATVRNQPDEAMPLRSELISRFRVTGAQVEAALFKMQQQKETGSKTKAPPDSLDLSRITGQDYQVDGFIVQNDQTQIWGNAGTGKTTVSVGISISVIYSEGFLDHEHPARRGAVLFIASDSGAAPLKGAIQDFGVAERPEFNEGPGKRFHVWASDQDQGMSAWSADLQGCIKLLHFVKEYGIDLVIIDSCKAALAGTDLEYTDNKGVTALLTFFKEVICPHTTVIWVNHDGAKSRGGDCPAGAKAWKEIPSTVHHITVPFDEETKRPVKSYRQWFVQKNRLGGTRDFLYTFADGELSVLKGQTTHGNCHSELVEGMRQKYLRSGLETSSKQDLYKVCPTHGAKTVANTLTTATRAKHPEICRRGRGLYALAPRLLDALKSVRSESGGTSSNSSSEQASSNIPSTSRPPESGTSPESRVIPDLDPWEDIGKKANPSHTNGSNRKSSQVEPHVKGLSGTAGALVPKPNPVPVDGACAPSQTADLKTATKTPLYKTKSAAQDALKIDIEPVFKSSSTKKKAKLGHKSAALLTPPPAVIAPVLRPYLGEPLPGIDYVHRAQDLPNPDGLPMLCGFDLETWNKRTDIWRHKASLFPFLGGEIRLAQVFDGTNTLVIDVALIGQTAIDWLRVLARDCERTLVGHNLLFEATHLIGAGIRPLCNWWDTMLASQTIGGLKEANLQAVAKHYIREDLSKIEQAGDWGNAITESKLRYAAIDAQVVLPLREALLAELEATKQVEVHRLDCCRISPAADGQDRGLAIDSAALDEIEAAATAEWDPKRTQLHAMLGLPNPEPTESQPYASTEQVHPRLVEALDGEQLTKGMKNKETGEWEDRPSTEKKVLQKFAGVPVVDLLLEVRDLDRTLLEVNQLRRDLEFAGGRTRPDYRLLGANTGRITTSGQIGAKDLGTTGRVINGKKERITSDSEVYKTGKRKGLPREIKLPSQIGSNFQGLSSRVKRALWTGNPDSLLLDIDWGSQEIRLQASPRLYNDRGFRRMILDGIDPHALMACTLFDLELPEDGIVKKDWVEKAQRSAAKPANFSLPYGCFVASLRRALSAAQDVAVSWEKAQAVYDTWHEFHRETSLQMDRFDPKKPGGGNIYECRSLAGRRVCLWGQAPKPDGTVPQFRIGRTNGVNWPIQSSGADMMSETLAEIWPALDRFPGTRIIGLVHDALLLEVPRSMAEEVKAIVVGAMTSDRLRDRYYGDIPLVADANFGENWEVAHNPPEMP